uniref:Golgi to ER traffic protein 4 n=1 Tax=Candidozyma auris TaxID=498019 RepID=A0A0L0NVT1_CANAR
MSDKLQRTIARFQQRIDNKDFYEAHQTLRTITNRYVKTKQYKDAIDLLYQGLTILAKNNEYASAGDLILYLVSVYEESGTPCSKESKAKIIELVSLLPATDPSLGDLSKRALQWSIDHDENKGIFGDPSLHHVFGVKLLNAAAAQPSEEEKHKFFSVAELHLILGTYESLPVYLDFLFKWHESEGGDAGLFLARAVINYAYLKNVHFVHNAVNLFLSKYIAEEKEPYEVCEEEGQKLYFFERSSLLNFLQLLAITLDKTQAGDKFMKLYTHYKPLLSQQCLTNSMDYIGRLFFNLNLGNTSGGGNMLANMMGSLFK